VSRLLGIVALVATFAVTATVATWTAPAARPASSAARCVKLQPAGLKALRSGLHPSFRPRLGKVRAVRASGDFSKAPRGFAKGVYFVSARLLGKGIATWAAGTSFTRSGGGLMFAVDKLARQASNFGADLPPSVLKGWGISSTTPGYARSRACVR
jgi:hypothetical protein